MALLRAELKGLGRTTLSDRGNGATGAAVHGVYEGVVETTGDLALPALQRADPGSMMFCTGNDTVYIKNSQGTWAAAGG